MASTKKPAGAAAPAKSAAPAKKSAKREAVSPTGPAEVAPVEARVTRARAAEGAHAGQFVVPAEGPLGVLFGVRHLSPMAGRQLEALMRELRPTAVLIEGPADATPMIEHLVRDDTQPPVALLAYTKQRPVRSIMYPLASYSPEWVALRVGAELGAWVRFMDLPASVFLGLGAERDEARRREAEARENSEENARDESEESRENASAARDDDASDSEAYSDDPYTMIATLSGDPDHDTWWERFFEHNAQPGAYRDAVYAFGEQLRALRDDPPERQRETLVREAFMRRVLHETIAAGHDPARVLVVCGAFHASVLTAAHAPMTDAELRALPSLDATMTIMPYSYFRLSAQSGYGAGNNAPGYYQALYEELRRSGDTARLGVRVLSALAAKLRSRGHLRSSAEVIEAVRLAQGMAALQGEATAPTLRDLRDAAMTCLGHGDATLVDEALHELAVGDAVGRVPAGVARTSLQDDFYLQLEALGLAKYLVDREQPIQGRASDGALDMREDTRASSAETALRDRRRSVFLHRLLLIDVPFAKLDRSDSGLDDEDLTATAKASTAPAGARTSKQQPQEHPAQNTFKEYWSARWTPNCEIALAECSLKGDSVAVAAARTLDERLALANDVALAAKLVRRAVLCDLPEGIKQAVRRLQALGVDDAAFGSIATGLYQLALLESYGSVRRFDRAPLRPIVSQLFLRATLLAHGASHVDDAGAKAVADALANVQYVAGIAHESALPVDHWYRALDTIADDDSANPFVCGAACALLVERGRASDESLERRVAKRILPGMDPDAVAGFFEGLASRNRYALFSRTSLWRALSDFLDALGDDEFRRAVAGLRRAFAKFEVAEIRRIAETLAKLWGESSRELVAALEPKLDEGAVAALSKDLEGLDLDFDM